MQALKRSGLDKNTLVIFTSDNGPWLNYGTHAGSALPLREGKGTVLEGGVRVPCVMRWPGAIPAGAVQDEPAMTIDILPTIASLISGDILRDDTLRHFTARLGSEAIRTGQAPLVGSVE